MDEYSVVVFLGTRQAIDRGADCVAYGAIRSKVPLARLGFVFLVELKQEEKKLSEELTIRSQKAPPVPDTITTAEPVNTTFAAYYTSASGIILICRTGVLYFLCRSRI